MLSTFFLHFLQQTKQYNQTWFQQTFLFCFAWAYASFLTSKYEFHLQLHFPATKPNSQIPTNHLQMKEQKSSMHLFGRFCTVPMITTHGPSISPWIVVKCFPRNNCWPTTDTMKWKIGGHGWRPMKLIFRMKPKSVSLSCPQRKLASLRIGWIFALTSRSRCCLLGRLARGRVQSYSIILRSCRSRAI